MTIDKAIRRLQAFIRWRRPDPNDNFNEAVQLGIEALKRLKKDREFCPATKHVLLPGETKE